MVQPVQVAAAFLLAVLISAVCTPLAGRVAVAVGAVDLPRERGVAVRPTPLLGGLAILAGVLAAGVLFLPATRSFMGILAGGTLVAIVGLLDDRFDLHPAVKLGGQAIAAAIPVSCGVLVDHLTLPFVDPVTLGWAAGPLTVLGLVALMNIVNFSDGVDGLAAGWSRATYAARYAVTIDTGTGRRLSLSPPGRRRSVVVGGFKRGEGARVRVVALTEAGRAGRAGTARSKGTLRYVTVKRKKRKLVVHHRPAGKKAKGR